MRYFTVFRDDQKKAQIDTNNVRQITFFKFVSEILRVWFVTYPIIPRVSSGATKIEGINQVKNFGIFVKMVLNALSINRS
jgi:hypothetical protein